MVNNSIIFVPYLFSFTMIMELLLIDNGIKIGLRNNAKIRLINGMKVLIYKVVIAIIKGIKIWEYIPCRDGDKNPVNIL